MRASAVRIFHHRVAAKSHVDALIIQSHSYVNLVNETDLSWLQQHADKKE